MKLKTVEQIFKKFELELVHTDADLGREVVSATISRMGIEITGGKTIGDSPHIIGWGTKEKKFFESKDESDIKNIISELITTETPLVILSNGMDGKVKNIILDICHKTKTPVTAPDLHLSEINIMVSPFLAEKLSPSVSIHSSLVIVNGYGVAIMGKSGIGKSEVVLELIQKGHSFVADDSVLIKRIGGRFFGEAEFITKGILEARGIGLIDVPLVYGYSSTKEQTEINLVIELIDADEIEDVDRLGTKSMTMKVLNGSIPKIELPVKTGRSTSVLVEVAVEAFVARQKGMNPVKLINKRSRE